MYLCRMVGRIESQMYVSVCNVVNVCRVFHVCDVGNVCCVCFVCHVCCVCYINDVYIIIFNVYVMWNYVRSYFLML
jgi:hypothetical protein